MKKAKFKISSHFLEHDMLHKCDGVSYDGEGKRAEELLNIISAKLSSALPKQRRKDVVKRLEAKHETASDYKEFISSLNEQYKKPFTYLEITQEEYEVWFKYWLEYYYDDDSIFADIRTQYPLYKNSMYYSGPRPKWLPNKRTPSWEYLEARKLLKRMKKVFDKSDYDLDHRAGTKMKFVQTLINTGIASKIFKSNDTVN